MTCDGGRFRIRDEELGNVASTLCSEAKKLGMDMAYPSGLEHCDDMNIEQCLAKCKKDEVELVLIVMPRRSSGDSLSTIIYD